MVKNEDKKGSNPYSISHPEMEKLLTSRKRNKDRDVSPVEFNPVHCTSSRFDDKKSAKTLSQLHRKQIGEMF